jgi:transcriptional regulator with XRE-family HTH domain
MTWQSEYLGLMTRLRRGRRLAGLSQADVAERLGISLRMFQRYEGSEDTPTGEAYEPKVMLLFHWASMVGVRITSDMTHSTGGEADGSAR